MKRSKYSNSINTSKPHIYLIGKRKWGVYLSAVNASWTSDYVSATSYCSRLNSDYKKPVSPTLRKDLTSRHLRSLYLSNALKIPEKLRLSNTTSSGLIHE